MRFPLIRVPNLNLNYAFTAPFCPVGQLRWTRDLYRLVGWNSLAAWTTGLVCYSSMHSVTSLGASMGTIAFTGAPPVWAGLQATATGRGPWLLGAGTFPNANVISLVDLVVDDVNTNPVGTPAASFDLPGSGWSAGIPGPSLPDAAPNLPPGFMWNAVPAYVSTAWTGVAGGPLMIASAPELGLPSVAQGIKYARIYLKDLTAGVANSEAVGAVSPPGADMLLVELQGLVPAMSVAVISKVQQRFKWVNLGSFLTIPGGILGFGADATSASAGTARTSLYYADAESTTNPLYSTAYPRIVDGYERLEGPVVPVGSAIALRAYVRRNSTLSAASTTYIAYPAVEVW